DTPVDLEDARDERGAAALLREVRAVDALTEVADELGRSRRAAAPHDVHAPPVVPEPPCRGAPESARRARHEGDLVRCRHARKVASRTESARSPRRTDGAARTAPSAPEVLNHEDTKT